MAISPEFASTATDLLGQLSTALTLCETLEQENTALKRAAATPRVTLQKVAAFDKSLLAATVAELEAQQMIDRTAATKLASDLNDDPNTALHLLRRVVQFSAAAPDEGVAVSKAAHGPTEDIDGWGKFLGRS